jgi:hypothetical protein
MPLYTRNKPKSYGPAQPSQDYEGPALEHLLKDDPVTPYFELPKDMSPRGILRYMQAQQVQKFGKTFLSQGIPEGAVLRGLKQLIQNYGAEIVARAIALGMEWANHPFAHGYVKKWCERAKTECSASISNNTPLSRKSNSE